MSLQERIKAEIERREQIATAPLDEAPGDWRVDHYSEAEFVVQAWDAGPDAEIMVTGSLADAKFIALHDPADALRRYAHYRKVLERHPSVQGIRFDLPDHLDRSALGCPRCAETHPCPEIRDLAEALGLSTEAES